MGRSLPYPASVASPDSEVGRMHPGRVLAISSSQQPEVAFALNQHTYALATDRCASPADDEYAHMIDASRNALFAFAESLRSA